MANLLMAAIRAEGHDITLESDLRTLDKRGNKTRQDRLRRIAEWERSRIARRWRTAQDNHPDVWLTYHLFHKAPDWLGPALCEEFSIPYVIAEASFAPKQQGGPWAAGHEQAATALGQASAVLGLSSEDRACVMPRLRKSAHYIDLKPFLDDSLLPKLPIEKGILRTSLADELGIPGDRVWLLAVGMMRPGDKQESYRILSDALSMPRVTELPWHLILVGDGEARSDVEGMFRDGFQQRVTFLGERAREQVYALMLASDLKVWPAVREAYGMVLVEALALGLPVLAGRTGGVPDIIESGRDSDRTGWLVQVGSAHAFADGIAHAFQRRSNWAEIGRRAQAKFAHQHTLAVAQRIIGDTLQRVVAER